LGEQAAAAVSVPTGGAVDAKALANLLLDWGEAEGVPVSPMKLQKLLFFIHADFLVKRCHALIKQEFEAWDHGPVIPSVYAEFKRFKNEPISSRAKSFDPIQAVSTTASCKLGGSDLRLVRELYEFYKNLSAFELSRRSHDFDGVWRQARSLFANGLNMDRRVSNEMVLAFHRPIHS
jgi:uncharacterized phage-associated protein